MLAKINIIFLMLIKKIKMQIIVLNDKLLLKIRLNYKVK